MNPSVRSILAISALVVILAACGTTAASAPESPAPASPAPAAPSEAPPASPDVAGTISVVDGVAVGGQGVSIAEAIASPMTEPVLVNGVLFMDTDGTLYLADSLTDASAPTFGELRLRVLDYPASEAEWDIENAELTGLQEANGILFFENKQVFGVIES
ncbi:MAG: hypothetical protein ACRDGV_13710 [Candidatus Limnocylindria bacterium]